MKPLALTGGVGAGGGKGTVGGGRWEALGAGRWGWESGVLNETQVGSVMYLL